MNYLHLWNNVQLVMDITNWLVTHHSLSDTINLILA